MKVKYVTQLLSHSIAVALYTQIGIEFLPQDAMGSAEFINLFNGLFDCLTAPHFRQRLL